MTSALAAFRTAFDAPAKSGPDASPAVFAVLGVAGLSSIETGWRAAAATAPDQAAFLDYGFSLALARYHEARGEQVVAAVVEWNGAAACILPVALTRQGGVRVAVLLGDPLAQYGDALLAEGAPAFLPGLALAALKDRPDIDVLAFRRVRADAALYQAIAEIARPGPSVVQAPYATFDPTDSVDALLLAIGGSKQKRERARLRRRLAEHGTLRFEARRGADALGLLKEAFALKSFRLDQAGHASPVVGDPAAVRAFEQAAHDPQSGEGIVAFRLSVGEVPAAFEIGVIRGRRYHAYLGVMAEAFASAGPGRVLMEDAIIWCREQGCDVIDLLPPADAYKRLWSNGVVDVRDFTVPTSLVGWLYAGPWLKIMRPRLRSWLRALPPSVRGRIGALALSFGAR